MRLYYQTAEIAPLPLLPGSAPAYGDTFQVLVLSTNHFGSFK